MQKVFIRVVEDPGATIHVNMKSTWVKKAVVKAGCLARLGTSLNTALVGVLLSLVGSARDPGAETLQWTRVRLLARVLSYPVSSHSSAVLSIKPEKAKKIYLKKKQNKTLRWLRTSAVRKMKSFVPLYCSGDFCEVWGWAPGSGSNGIWLWMAVDELCPLNLDPRSGVLGPQPPSDLWSVQLQAELESAWWWTPLVYSSLLLQGYQWFWRSDV